MLTKHDELFCHQIAAPFDNVSDSGPLWTERVWATVHDKAGKIVFCPGFCYNPNRNTLDAYAVLSVDDKAQYDIRASRALRPNIEEVKVGPMSYQILDPLKKIRYALGENKYGFSYDVVLEAVTLPVEEDLHFRYRRGRIVDNCYRYAQGGQASGWVNIEGKRYEVDPSTWVWSRDHSWGIRGLADASQFEVGLQPSEPRTAGMHQFACLTFDGWFLHYVILEDNNRVVDFSGGIAYPWGDLRPQIRLKSPEHDFKIDPALKRMQEGRIVGILEDGSKLDISMRFLGSVDLGRTTGHSPVRGYVHGHWMGPYWEDGEKYDLTDPKMRQQYHSSHEHAVECQCGGKTGYGLLELVGWSGHKYAGPPAQ